MTTKIMIADFLYDNDKGPSYFLVPLNIGYITSYSKKIFGDKFEFKLFRNVDKFIQSFNDETPHIVAFAQYIWNDNLAKNILGWVKGQSPNVMAVAGGPMIGATEESVSTFLKQNPLVDFCTTAYGEHGFSEVLKRYLDCNGDLSLMKKNIIEGVSFCVEGNHIHSIVDQFTVKPDDIPSPYTTGLLDSFLKEGYSPIIQGMRGCPYTCTYCFGAKLSIGKFSDGRALDELKYIYERTESSALAVTDDNFGIYERDIEIAKYIRKIYDERGYPNKLLMYYSKKPTKIIFEISKILGELAPFFISYQSRNQKTLDAVKRYNLSDEKSKVISNMCHENNIHITSEMIFGLPYETKETFTKGVEELYQLNVDTIAIYHCKFFNGTDIASRASFDSFNFTTKHRFYEDNFQVFKTHTSYGDIIACETDQIPVASSTYNFQDYLDIRMLGFWIELCFAEGVYYEILKHLENYGFSPFSFIQDVIDNKIDIPPKVREFLQQVESEFKKELFDSHDDLIEEYCRIIKNNPKFKSKKINLYYGFLIIYTDIHNDFDDFVKTASKNKAKELLSDESYDEFIQPLDQLFDYQTNKIVNLTAFETGGNFGVSKETEEPIKKGNISKYRVVSDYDYDFIQWEKDRYSRPLSEYRNTDKTRVIFEAKNPKQFEVFVNAVEKEMRPFTWHNYIDPINVKAQCLPLRNEQ